MCDFCGKATDLFGSVASKAVAHAVLLGERSFLSNEIPVYLASTHNLSNSSEYRLTTSP
jgi:hypothetical protein